MRYLASILALLLVACSDKKSDTVKKKKLPPPTISESNLSEFTGARTKVVWAQYTNPDKVDKQGTSRHHFLIGIDSADGRGEHKILSEKGNYAYPIITPDGNQIVFTRKVKVTKGSKRKFDTTIEIVNFDGSGLRKLGEGYAQEVWAEPGNGRYWIYAGSEFVLAGGTAPICKRIIRFPIDDPSKREVVWEKTQMGTDSFAISGDGKRFAGLFPWPDAGIGNLEENSWNKVGNGCWVAMAPDNSYDMWVFDGKHRNFMMYDANGKNTAKVPVDTHPDIGGQEMYHPRWGNHRQFFVLSGPHASSKNRKGTGKAIEIYMGKFSKENDRVESWLKISNNGLPDIYPDMWVEGGTNAALVRRAPIAPKIDTTGAKWPSNPEGLLFKWENVRAQNEFTAPDGSNQVTKVEPKGLARYGRHYEMILDGGSFVPKLGSADLVEKSSTEEPFSFQCLITANSHGGEIWNREGIRLFLQEGSLSGTNYSKLKLDFGEGGSFQFDEIELGVPTHICIVEENGSYIAYQNGHRVESSLVIGSHTSAPSQKELVFGNQFDGSLECLAFYNRALTPEEIATDAALMSKKLEERKPIEQIKLKGKLVAMSEMPDTDSIKPYVRSLVYYLYETEDPDHKQIAVAHWAILDNTPVPGMPRELGKTYDLVLEHFDDHRQLTSQNVSSDEEKIPSHLLLFYDVTNPAK